MRPVFEVPVAAPAGAVLAQIRVALDEPGVRVEGVVMRAQAELTTRRVEAHFWSPCLSVEVLPRGDGAWALRGRFSPEPNVWMIFMAIYGMLALGAVGGLMYGVSQMIIGEAPWAFAAIPAALALMAFTYGAVFIGQGLGSEEMYRLRSFVDDCVEGAERATDTAPGHPRP